MGNHKGLIDRLRKHSRDYVDGRTQDFSEVIDDCIIAANALDVAIAERDDLEKECNTLRARLEHLLLSVTVRRFDAKNGGQYIRDIRELDKLLDNAVTVSPDLACGLLECTSAPDVFFLCDRTACENCNSECKHTSNIEHAKNFKIIADGRAYFEQES